MTRPHDTDPATAETTEHEPGGAVEKNTPDMFKKQTSQTNGERVASYHAAPRAPARGEDTQEIQPAVLLDQTQNEGFSGAKIREYVRQIEAREGTTVAIRGRDEIPKSRRGRVLLLVAGGVVALVALFFLLRPHETPQRDGVITPVSTELTAPTASASSPPSISSGEPSASSSPVSSTSSRPVASHSEAPLATHLAPTSHPSAAASSAPSAPPSASASSDVFFPHN